jgi:hypothetical protein
VFVCVCVRACWEGGGGEGEQLMYVCVNTWCVHVCLMGLGGGARGAGVGSVNKASKHHDRKMLINKR